MKKMKKSARLIFVLTLVLSLMVGATATVLADWNEGDPHKMHYPQLPDIASGQVFESSSNSDGVSYMADDFQCTETGYITDIHVWGGWGEDNVCSEVSFCNDDTIFWIGIYDDIPDPDGEGPEYSMPGPLRWEKEFYTGDYDRIGPWYSDGIAYYYPDSPPSPDFWGIVPCSNIYQYNFWINPEDAFVQQAGTTYWLSVVLTYANDDDWENLGIAGMWWGWISSLNAWNDDAAWDFSYPPDPLGWQELYYIECPEDCIPSAFSADLAFVITGEPLPGSSPPPSQPSPSGDAVGGEVYPVNKVGLIAPWIALGVIIIAGGVFLIRRRVHS